MIARLVVLGMASVILLGCEPVDKPAEDGAAASQAAGDTSMPEGLNSEQRLIWSTFSDKGKAQVNACMASGKSFRACAGV